MSPPMPTLARYTSGSGEGEGVGALCASLMGGSGWVSKPSGKAALTAQPVRSIIESAIGKSLFIS